MGTEINTLLDAVKLSLRISTAAFDAELEELIGACRLDLKMKGVRNVDDNENLTRQAVKLYCRANFANGDTKERELYADRYEKLAAAMSLCAFYNSGEAADDGA